MKNHTKYIDIEGEKVKANCPVIISASRSTDIPAFYSEWFINRLKKGYVKWKNPFNGISYYNSFSDTRLIVFWSKNPKPMLKYLQYLDNNFPNYYFQYTLNDYVKEGLEKKVPPLDARIETFIELSEKIGKEKVVWRFDPLILTNNIKTDDLLEKIEKIGDRLKNHTNKLVFSYADISIYKKVQSNLKKEGILYSEFTVKAMNDIAIGLSKLNKHWGFEIGTCSEKIDLDKYGIIHNKCIDDDLIVKLFNNDFKLLDYLGIKTESMTLFNETTKKKNSKILKDKGQRKLCGCIISKDIGQYNTCPHGCVYCYANTSRQTARINYQRHLDLKMLSDTIT